MPPRCTAEGRMGDAPSGEVHLPPQAQFAHMSHQNLLLDGSAQHLPFSKSPRRINGNVARCYRERLERTAGPNAKS